MQLLQLIKLVQFFFPTVCSTNILVMLVRLVRLVQLSVDCNAPSNDDRYAGNTEKNALSIAYGDLIAKKACLEMHGKMFIIFFCF